MKRLSNISDSSSMDLSGHFPLLFIELECRYQKLYFFEKTFKNSKFSSKTFFEENVDSSISNEK